jgi:hypothetical protein
MGVKFGLSHSSEHRLRVFEKRALRKIRRSKRDEAVGEAGENCIMRSSIICILHQILLG